MNLKRLIIVVAGLAVLSALVYLSTRPGTPNQADPRVGQPLLAASTVDPAAQVAIKDEGKTVELTRSASGAWEVKNFYGLPVDFQKLARFTADLTDAKVTRFVTSNPARLARLDFKDTSIELRDAGGHPLWTIFLGKAADTGGRFVRFGEEPKAYLTSWGGYLDAEPKNWADAELLNVKPDDVAKIVLPLPSGPLAISRAKKDAPWKADPVPAGQQLDPSKVNSVLTSLANLRFSESTDPAVPDATAAKAAARTFVLTTFDNKTYTIGIGRRPEEKKLKASTPESGGPAALGKASATPPPGGETGAPKPLAPEFETVPAGPVYASVQSSDPAAPINVRMTKRAYQIPEYVFTALPQKPEEIFQPVPTPAPAPSPAAATATPPPPPAAVTPGERALTGAQAPTTEEPARQNPQPAR